MVFSSVAFACSGVPYISTRDAVADATGIYLGTVIRGGEEEVVLDVSSTLKGTERDKVRVQRHFVMDPIAHEVDHDAALFWEEHSTNSFIYYDCGLISGAVTGAQYLYLEGVDAVWSFERIESPDDLWLKYVTAEIQGGAPPIVSLAEYLRPKSIALASCEDYRDYPSLLSRGEIIDGDIRQFIGHRQCLRSDNLLLKLKNPGGNGYMAIVGVDYAFDFTRVEHPLLRDEDRRPHTLEEILAVLHEPAP